MSIVFVVIGIVFFCAITFRFALRMLRDPAYAYAKHKQGKTNARKELERYL